MVTYNSTTEVIELLKTAVGKDNANAIIADAMANTSLSFTANNFREIISAGGQNVSQPNAKIILLYNDNFGYDANGNAIHSGSIAGELGNTDGSELMKNDSFKELIKNNLGDEGYLKHYSGYEYKQ